MLYFANQMTDMLWILTQIEVFPVSLVGKIQWRISNPNPWYFSIPYPYFYKFTVNAVVVLWNSFGLLSDFLVSCGDSVTFGKVFSGLLASFGCAVAPPSSMVAELRCVCLLLLFVLLSPSSGSPSRGKDSRVPEVKPGVLKARCGSEKKCFV